MQDESKRITAGSMRARTDRYVCLDIVRIAALAAVYYYSGKSGLQAAFLNRSASAIWPPTGIALAILLLHGTRYWPGVWIGAFLLNLTTGAPVLSAMAIAGGNTLEAVLGVLLVTRFANGPRAFERAADIFKYVLLAALLSTVVSASTGVTSLILTGVVPLAKSGPVWFTWWLGDAVSAVILTPLIVIWRTTAFPRRDRRLFLEACLIGTVLLLISFFGFGGLPGPVFGRLPRFLFFPVLLWAAYRFGPRGAITTVCAMAGVALWGTLRGKGPFVMPDPNDSLLLLQMYMGTITVTNLVLGAVVAEYKVAAQSLQSTGTQERARATQLEAILRAVPAAVWISRSVDCQHITGNPAANDLLNLPPGANASKSGSDATWTAHFTFWKDGRELRTEELPIQRAARGMTIQNFEAEVRFTGGSARDLIGNAAPLRDSKGQPCGAVAAFVDITEHKLAERALREKEEQFAGLFQSAMDAIIIVDAGQRVVLFNPAAEAMFGCPAATVIGQPLDGLIPAAFLQTHPAAVAAGAPLATRASGEKFPFEASVSQMEIGGRKLSTVILRDISARVKAEAELTAWQCELELRVAGRTAELNRAHQQLQAEITERQRLEVEIARAVEREQLRLGQELHDGLGQQLTGISYLMKALTGKLGDLPRAPVKDAERLQSLLLGSIEQTRNLAKGFYPVELERHGLLSALKKMAGSAGCADGPTIVVQADENPAVAELTGPIAIQLFRIAQEAVHNVVQHSQATRVMIRLSTVKGQITLIVMDNGAGLPANLEAATGMGLRIMHYRASLAGGKLDIHNHPGGGVIVTCTVLLPEPPLPVIPISVAPASGRPDPFYSAAC